VARNLILISGNLGTGKSTLASGLANRLGWLVMEEPVSDNPYLALFYERMDLWAFHLQLYFLGVRAEQHRAASVSPASVILDRSLDEDANVFAPVLQELGYIHMRDYLTYRRLFALLDGHCQIPDLILFLRAPTDVLLDRIRRRGLPFDQHISSKYLDIIQKFYDRWLSSVTVPVMTIDSARVDFSSDPSAIEEIVSSLSSRFGGSE
jgi:deoxyadenosine/deoxycytidine kinase